MDKIPKTLHTAITLSQKKTRSHFHIQTCKQCDLQKQTIAFFQACAKGLCAVSAGLLLTDRTPLVDCPTRWSLWYGYLDFYVDHLFRYPDDLRNIVQQCANLGGAITSTYIGIAMWKIKIIYSVLYFLTVALTHQSVIRVSLILTLKISIFPAM